MTKTLIDTHWSVSKNKTIEFEVGHDDYWSYLHFHINITRRQNWDHAGFRLHIELFGFGLTFMFCDNRHSIESEEYDDEDSDA